MKISYVYKKVKEVMAIIENINFIELESRVVKIDNQRKLNKVYNILNNFKDELIREKIISNQKHNKN